MDTGLRLMPCRRMNGKHGPQATPKKEYILLNSMKPRTSINNSKLSTGDNELFGMELLYDVGNSNVDNTPSYSGNLTGIKWMTRDTLGNKGVERSYHYNYDNVNRFTGAYYGERPTAGTGTFTDNPGGFSENGLSYDQNGNIQTLYRYSSTPGGSSRTAIDSLAYTYNTNDANQLLKVTDATGNNLGFGNFTGSTGSYAYDTEGNLTSDPYKGINITYDVLNKTDTVKLATNKYMTYTYDAGGNLLRKQQTNGSTVSTTDYIDGFVYMNTLLAYFPSPEGRVLSTGSSTVQSQYTITDPQGNARVSFVDNGGGTAKIVQEDSYYATGLIMQNSNVNTPPVPNKNLYNGGSEWQNDFSNLPDYYETFYRDYDPAIARFNAIDPVADATESMSTYQYANDNPVMGNDPMGDWGVLHDVPPKHHMNEFGDNLQWLLESTQEYGQSGFSVSQGVDDAYAATILGFAQDDPSLLLDFDPQNTTMIYVKHSLISIPVNTATPDNIPPASPSSTPLLTTNAPVPTNTATYSYNITTDDYSDPSRFWRFIWNAVDEWGGGGQGGPYTTFANRIVQNSWIGYVPVSEDEGYKSGSLMMRADVSLSKSPAIDQSGHLTGEYGWYLTVDVASYDNIDGDDVKIAGNTDLLVNGTPTEAQPLTISNLPIVGDGWTVVGRSTYYLTDSNIGNVQLQINATWAYPQGNNNWILPTTYPLNPAHLGGTPIIFNPTIQISNP
jgi:RHS repeat-associated protein